jgi:hypothetical protein
MGKFNTMQCLNVLLVIHLDITGEGSLALSVCGSASSTTDNNNVPAKLFRDIVILGGSNVWIRLYFNKNLRHQR